MTTLQNRITGLGLTGGLFLTIHDYGRPGSATCSTLQSPSRSPRGAARSALRRLSTSIWPLHVWRST